MLLSINLIATQYSHIIMRFKLVAINVINLMIIFEIKRMDSVDKTVLSQYPARLVIITKIL